MSTTKKKSSHTKKKSGNTKKTPSNTKNTKKKISKKKSPQPAEADKGLPKISENFSEWFNTVIFQADIIDYRYKGL